MAKSSILASQVLEIVDESSNVVLIFELPEDQDALTDYDEAQLSGTEFDYNRIRTQALDLRSKLDDFLEDLKRFAPRPEPRQRKSTAHISVA